MSYELLQPYDARHAAFDVAKDIGTESETLQLAAAIAPGTNENTRFFNDATRDCVAAVIVAFNRVTPLKWDLRDVLINAWLSGRRTARRELGESLNQE
jgi:hypothetical protein